MRHRQLLLIGMGICSLWQTFVSNAIAQQHPNYRILKHPAQPSASKYYFTLMGEVGRPGVYESNRPQITLPELIEMAGGLNEESASRNIFTFRDGRPGPQTFYTQDSQFVLMPGDILAAGRRPNHASDRGNHRNGTVHSTPVEPAQVVVLGIEDRPVFLTLPSNTSTIPGLIALLHQDNNPQRSLAVYPPRGRPFSYNAQNTEPAPLESGSIVMFDPQKVMRDGLPPLPPVANALSGEQSVDRISSVSEPQGPKVLIAPALQSVSANSPASPDEGMAVENRFEPQRNSMRPDSQSNHSAPKFHFTSRQETVPTGKSENAQSKLSVDDPALNSGPDMSLRQENAELKFPAGSESILSRTTENLESPVDSIQNSSQEEAPSSGRDGDSLTDAESLPLVPMRESGTERRATTEFPIWTVMAITGIGFFCLAGLVVLLRDMQHFKKIVIQTQHTQSILDQLLRGELPLHEETVEMTEDQHFSARPNPPLRRYRPDMAHQAAGQERWIPEPHVAFESGSETVEEQPAQAYRVDREGERLASRRVQQPPAESRRAASSASSTTVLDRILSSVNGDRNARRS